MPTTIRTIRRKPWSHRAVAHLIRKRLKPSAISASWSSLKRKDSTRTSRGTRQTKPKPLNSFATFSVTEPIDVKSSTQLASQSATTVHYNKITLKFIYAFKLLQFPGSRTPYASLFPQYYAKQRSFLQRVIFQLI